MKVIGIDTGGTFTDLVLHNPKTGGIKIAKIPSTPHNPAIAVEDIVKQVDGVAARVERGEARDRHDEGVS